MIEISDCVKEKDCKYFCGPYEFVTGKNFPKDCPVKNKNEKEKWQNTEKNQL